MKAKFYIILSTLLVILSSCSTERENVQEAEYVNFNIDSLIVSSSFTDTIIKLESNTNWIADSKESWIHTTKRNANELSVSIPSNTEYNDRKGSIDFISLDNTILKTLKVRQKQLNVILINKEKEINISSDPTILSIPISRNISNLNITTPNWIKQKVTRSLINENYEFEVSENKSSSSRIGDIVFNKGEKTEKKVTIIQKYAEAQKISVQIPEYIHPNQTKEIDLNITPSYAGISDIECTVEAQQMYDGKLVTSSYDGIKAELDKDRKKLIIQTGDRDALAYIKLKKDGKNLTNNLVASFYQLNFDTDLPYGINEVINGETIHLYSTNCPNDYYSLYSLNSLVTITSDKNFKVAENGFGIAKILATNIYPKGEVLSQITLNFVVTNHRIWNVLQSDDNVKYKKGAIKMKSKEGGRFRNIKFLTSDGTVIMNFNLENNPTNDTKLVIFEYTIPQDLLELYNGSASWKIRYDYGIKRNGVYQYFTRTDNFKFNEIE